MFAWIATRTGVQLPSPPVFARNVVESEDCRAVALGEGGPSYLQHCPCELRRGKPVHGNFYLRLHPSKRSQPQPILHRVRSRLARSVETPQRRQGRAYLEVETVAPENVHRHLGSAAC